MLIGGLTTDNHLISSSGEGLRSGYLLLYRRGDGIALPPTPRSSPWRNGRSDQ